MVKVSYKQANAHPDCGAVKVNGCYFGVSTLYYKNGASSTYDGADGVWNAHYDPTTGVLELKNIKKPDQVRRFLSDLVEQKRSETGIKGREIYGSGNPMPPHPGHGPDCDTDGDGDPDCGQP